MVPGVNVFIKEEFLESKLGFMFIENMFVKVGDISQCRKVRYKRIRPGDGKWFEAKDNHIDKDENGKESGGWRK